MRVIKVTPAGRGYDLVCEIEISYGFLWLKKRKELVTYRGDHTVFHDLTTGERPGTLMEVALGNALWLWKETGRPNPI